MTDTELNQLRQKLQRQFQDMMRDEPVATQEATDTQWQPSSGR